MTNRAELEAVARRVVWFYEPEAALLDTTLFLAHVMTYGTIEDLITTKQFFTDDDFRRALEQAPAGVFDPRSWAYWNTMFDRLPVPPMPRRRIFDEQNASSSP